MYNTFRNLPEKVVGRCWIGRVPKLASLFGERNKHTGRNAKIYIFRCVLPLNACAFEDFF